MSSKLQQGIDSPAMAAIDFEKKLPLATHEKAVEIKAGVSDAYKKG